jgi:hypothetical protein
MFHSSESIKMTYWIKRIILKSGELVTEKELRPDENRFEGPHPMLGDLITVTCRGQTFEARVVAGPGRQVKVHPETLVPLRVEEI